MEAKLIVELWESETQAGPFCNRNSDKSSQKWGSRDVISHLCQISFFLL